MKKMSLLIIFVTVGNWCRNLKKKIKKKDWINAFFVKHTLCFFVIFLSFKQLWKIKIDTFYSVQRRKKEQKSTKKYYNLFLIDEIIFWY